MPQLQPINIRPLLPGVWVLIRALIYTACFSLLVLPCFSMPPARNRVKKQRGPPQTQPRRSSRLSQIHNAPSQQHSPTRQHSPKAPAHASSSSLVGLHKLPTEPPPKKEHDPDWFNHVDPTSSHHAWQYAIGGCQEKRVDGRVIPVPQECYGARNTVKCQENFDPQMVSEHDSNFTAQMCSRDFACRCVKVSFKQGNTLGLLLTP